VPQDAPWKIRHETFETPMDEAAGHLRALHEALAT
jgi:hypothetical protein